MIKNYTKPFSESNFLPSMATFENPEQGVRSQLATQLKKEPEYNGLTIPDLRGLQGAHQLDKLDMLAVATQKLAQSAKVYKESALHTAFAHRMSNPKK